MLAQMYFFRASNIVPISCFLVITTRTLPQRYQTSSFKNSKKSFKKIDLTYHPSTPTPTPFSLRCRRSLVRQWRSGNSTVWRRGAASDRPGIIGATHRPGTPAHSAMERFPTFTHATTLRRSSTGHGHGQTDHVGTRLGRCAG